MINGEKYHLSIGSALAYAKMGVIDGEIEIDMEKGRHYMDGSYNDTIKIGENLNNIEEFYSFYSPQKVAIFGSGERPFI